MKTTFLWIAQCINCLQLMHLVHCAEDMEGGTGAVALDGTSKRDEVHSLPFWANRGRRGAGEEFGPFWANRGRRTMATAAANKWHTRIQEPLYAQEPRWILVRRDDVPPTANRMLAEPFFMSRGKKRDPPTDDGPEQPCVDDQCGTWLLDNCEPFAVDCLDNRAID